MLKCEANQNSILLIRKWVHVSKIFNVINQGQVVTYLAKIFLHSNLQGIFTGWITDMIGLSLGYFYNNDGT